MVQNSPLFNYCVGFQRFSLFCKTSVNVTDVPTVACLHRANKFASAAAHLPAALAGQSLQKRENL